MLEAKKRDVNPKLTETDPLYTVVKRATQEAYDYRAKARTDYGT